MVNEFKVLEVVSKVTNTPAFFYNGTLFLETTDSAIATRVFDAIWSNVTAAVAFQKVGSETAFDFLG
jgi:hypothetical protein